MSDRRWPTDGTVEWARPQQVHETELNERNKTGLCNEPALAVHGNEHDPHTTPPAALLKHVEQENRLWSVDTVA